jgi:hypothetical protein
MRKLIIATILSLSLVAIPSSPAFIANKHVVGCFNFQTGRVDKKVKPRHCAVVVTHQCGGWCSADQVYLDHCAWRRWTRRARGHCTWRANMGYHNRVSVKLHRVRSNRFTRARIGGHHFRVSYDVSRPAFRGT